jgi:hypothetical protein
MCGIVLDTLVMYGVIAMVSGERPDDYLTPLLVSVGFSLTMGACAAYLPVALALAALLPLVILFGVILSALFGMPLKRAILGSCIFLAYKVALVVAFAFLLP